MTFGIPRSLAWLVVVAVAALTFALATPGRAAATLGPLSGQLVVSRDNNLWIIPLDGGAQRQVTNVGQGLRARDPVFSPDGTRIAYGLYKVNAPVTTPGSAEIWLINVDGSGAARLVGSPDAAERFENPAWSGNDTVYYGRDKVLTQNGLYAGDELSVELVKVSTGAREPIARNSTTPTVSGDGATLAYVRLANYQISLLVQPAAPGQAARRLVAPNDFFEIWTPRLSPDGSVVAFAGSGRTTGGGQPTWSPTSWLQPFWPEPASAHGLPFDLWAINRDGTNLRRLASVQVDEFYVAWSPDGSMLATSGWDGVWVMNADGSARTQVTPRGESAGIDWR